MCLFPTSVDAVEGSIIFHSERERADSWRKLIALKGRESVMDERGGFVYDVKGKFY